MTGRKKHKMVEQNGYFHTILDNNSQIVEIKLALIVSGGENESEKRTFSATGRWLLIWYYSYETSEW